MIVYKFGGSSISNSKNIINVFEIIKSKSNIPVLIVFSAIGKTTNKLIESGQLASLKKIEYEQIIQSIFDDHNSIIKHLNLNSISFLEQIDQIYQRIKNLCLGIFYLGEISPKIQDSLISNGEILSALIIFNFFIEKLNSKNIIFIDSVQIIKTDSCYGKANVNYEITYNNIEQIKNINFDIAICSGFIGSNIHNQITTIGRGGGDYSAALYGSGLNSKSVEIWTDVNGIMTADPRIISNPKTIDYINYDEMMELSHYGANVIYTPTIIPLYKSKIPIYIKNTFNPTCNGTIIGFKNNIESHNNYLATAISQIKEISLIKVFGDYLIGRVGFSQNLFSCLAQNNINIIMISQSSCEYSIYIVINRVDLIQTKNKLLEEYNLEIKNKHLEIEFFNDKSVLAIETYNHKNIPKIMLQIYHIFVNENTTIYTQTTSDHNICVVIDQKDLNSIIKKVYTYIFE